MDAASGPVRILPLGRVAYDEALARQHELVAERREGLIPDSLLLLEHEPVYTIGRSSRQPVPAGLPHPVRVIERGGDLTYHGPGQLVGYPIVHLGDAGLTVRGYLRKLESILVAALAELGVGAQPLPGFTGVWTGGRKIASIGVAVSRSVTYHGFSLNVDMDLGPWRAIHPCRLEPGQITSLSAALGRPVVLAEAARAVSGAFSQ